MPPAAAPRPPATPRERMLLPPALREPSATAAAAAAAAAARALHRDASTRPHSDISEFSDIFADLAAGAGAAESVAFTRVTRVVTDEHGRRQAETVATEHRGGRLVQEHRTRDCEPLPPAPFWRRLWPPAS